MRRHIEAALRETYGRVQGPHGGAQLLHINPHTLRARMRKLKIDRRQFRVQDVSSRSTQRLRSTKSATTS
jgi:hydrogenase-4 transcriptional activator